MGRAFAFLVILAGIAIAATGAAASPFLVCDPQAGVQYYELTGLPIAEQVDAQADGSIRLDLASLPVGAYSITARACVELWGCSDPTPFQFARPEGSSAPTAIRLSR